MCSVLNFLDKFASPSARKFIEIWHFSLVILILTFGASLFWRRSFGNGRGLARIVAQINAENVFKYIFIFSIFLIFSLLFYQSYQQYQSWSQNEFSKYLLPPYQSINYFIFYQALARFFAPYLISLAIAILFLFSAKILNKKCQERFFYPEEPYFGAIAIFLTGHPGWLFYFAILIFIYLILHLSLVVGQLSSVKCQLSMVNGKRLSLYYLWLPMAIFVIIIQDWLAKLPLWSLLKL